MSPRAQLVRQTFHTQSLTIPWQNLQCNKSEIKSVIVFALISNYSAVLENLGFSFFSTIRPTRFFVKVTSGLAFFATASLVLQYYLTAETAPGKLTSS